MISIISNNLIEFTLIASIIILLIISHWISAYKNHKNKKITLKEAQNDENSYKNYVKKYYVTNIYFTLVAVSLYFIASYSFLIYLRYYTIQNYTNKQTMFPIDTAFSNIKNPIEDLTTLFQFVGPLIIYLTLLIGVFVAFKVFIHILFFDEVLKLHLYFHNSLLYLRIKKITRDQYLRKFFGSCYLFIYNVSNLKTLSDIDGLEDSNDFNVYNTIYENATICKFSFKCVNLSKKYYFMHYLFKSLLHISKFFYRHLNYTGFFLYIPYILYSIALIYDFFYLQFYYSYYLLVPMFIVHLWCQYILFMQARSESHEYKLYIYFYDELNRKSKRPLNSDVLAMQYIINEFQNVYEEKNTKLKKKNLKTMYQRYFLIVINGILASIVIKQNLYSVLIVPLYLRIPMSIIISILLISTIYCSINTFKLPKDKKYNLYFLGNYIYSKTSNILFWILILIQLYLYWLLIVKNTLFIIYDNVVWEQANVRIIRNYTVENMLKLLYDYFDKVVIQLKLPEDHVVILKQFIEHLTLKNIITDYTKIEDLKNLLTITLLEDYLKCYQYWEELAIQDAAKHAAIKVIMDGVSNIITLITFWKFFTVYLGAYLLIIRHPIDPGISKLIIFWVRRWF